MCKALQKALDAIAEYLTIFVRAIVSSLEFEIKRDIELSSVSDGTILHVFNNVFHKHSTMDLFQGLNSK